MTVTSHPSDTPYSILYTMLRVHNLDRSISFYRNAFGMVEVRRETFPDARFTLVFMGYVAQPDGATIELTWNWDSNAYIHGTGFGHIALAVPDIHVACARLADMGVTILRPAGPMTHAPQETGHRENIAFVSDPDGYRIELIEQNP
jgi:lactoylglutathione lyase